MDFTQLNTINQQLTGLFGYPVEHSLSPVMHNSAFKQLELDYHYLPFEVEPSNLESAVEGIKALGLRGVNLTIPHKESVIPYLDELSQSAELIGAVNTIKQEEGRLIGYNTDGRGFVRSLNEADFTPQDKSGLIIGAGGAARAIAFQLVLEGLDRLYIANRTLSKAESLVQEVGQKLDLEQIEAIALDEKVLREIIGNLDLVVDTTPVGMSPQADVEPVINPQLLHSGLVVSDLVYNPLETTLLQAAEKRGATTISGLGMLVHQGAIAFELWTGKQAPLKVMKRATKSQL
ncbi:MAG: shikimate dehydrogenase [Bacillota bacterium]